MKGSPNLAPTVAGGLTATSVPSTRRSLSSAIAPSDIREVTPTSVRRPRPTLARWVCRSHRSTGPSSPDARTAPSVSVDGETPRPSAICGSRARRVTHQCMNPSRLTRRRAAARLRPSGPGSTRPILGISTTAPAPTADPATTRRTSAGRSAPSTSWRSWPSTTAPPRPARKAPFCAARACTRA